MNEKWIGVRNRAFGAPSVYFGPFDSAEAVMEFADNHGLALAVICLTDPDSNQDDWWQ